MVSIIKPFEFWARSIFRNSGSVRLRPQSDSPPIRPYPIQLQDYFRLHEAVRGSRRFSRASGTRWSGGASRCERRAVPQRFSVLSKVEFWSQIPGSTSFSSASDGVSELLKVLHRKVTRRNAAVGGSMKSAFHSRSFRRAVLFLSAGASLLFGWYGVLLIIESFTGHGSPVGSTFVFALGSFCLCVSAFVLIVCAIKWNLEHRNH